MAWQYCYFCVLDWAYTLGFILKRHHKCTRDTNGLALVYSGGFLINFCIYSTFSFAELFVHPVVVFVAVESITFFFKSNWRYANHTTYGTLFNVFSRLITGHQYAQYTKISSAKQRQSFNNNICLKHTKFTILLKM